MDRTGSCASRPGRFRFAIRTPVRITPPGGASSHPERERWATIPDRITSPTGRERATSGMWPGRGGPEGPPRHWFNRRGVDMPTCKIDGKVCEFEDGDSILKVAWMNGIPIPHYCYHDGLSIPAQCRICLVEIWAPNPRNENKLEPRWAEAPALLPDDPPATAWSSTPTAPRPSPTRRRSWSTCSSTTRSTARLRPGGRVRVAGLLLQVRPGRPRFEETKVKQPKKDLGPNVYIYSDRCIMCTRCVRFARESPRPPSS
jgi:ferredoxin